MKRVVVEKIASALAIKCVTKAVKAAIVATKIRRAAAAAANPAVKAKAKKNITTTASI